MASPRTLARNPPLRSNYRRVQCIEPVSAEERRAILATPPGQRQVRATWRSLDGRLYAHDGLSIHRIR